ncbi:cytochrome c [Paucibacter sp. AS339]|uniref:c-type cytochrome n=1 Tax=Paucibacter hankyongi TaxID=3133434 RepID=UPI0030A3208E
MKQRQRGAWTWALGGLLGLFAVASLAVYGLNHLDEGSTPSDEPQASASLIERGAYLARAGNCQGCHTQRGGAPYAGGRAIPTPFGSVFTPNLTPDDKTGLGQWRADDFWRALHHGRGKDGRLLTPAFPYTNYSLVTRADADALYFYLRSLPAVAQPNLDHELRFPYNTQAALAVWRALYFRPAVFTADPSRSASWNRGAYLSQGLGHCNACHASRNSLGATVGLNDFSGNMLEGLGWYAPSLHSAAQAGVANWDRQALSSWLKTGRNSRASAQGPMAEVIQGSTQYLSPDDLNAMAEYLQGLPQHPEAAGVRQRPELKLREMGQALYGEHCASCHGEQGAGVAGAYPALAGNRAVLMAHPANLLRIIQRGGFAPATTDNPRPFGMPPFAGVLDDTQQAAVASFVRNAWGNQPAGAADVRPVDVLRLKARRVD